MSTFFTSKDIFLDNNFFSLWYPLVFNKFFFRFYVFFWNLKFSNEIYGKNARIKNRLNPGTRKTGGNRQISSEIFNSVYHKYGFSYLRQAIFQMWFCYSRQLFFLIFSEVDRSSSLNSRSALIVLYRDGHHDRLHWSYLCGGCCRNTSILKLDNFDPKITTVKRGRL